MFCFSLYEDTSAPSLTSPEADNCDKWPGEAIFPGFNYNQEFLVPELFLLENVDCLPEKYDDVEPEEELMSILEEIITEDKKKTEGEAKLYTSTKRAKLIWAGTAEIRFFTSQYKLVSGHHHQPVFLRNSFDRSTKGSVFSWFKNEKSLILLVFL